MIHDFENVLVASGISKFFPGAVALDKVDFTLRKGEVHALLGENGAGKSTLIKCMTGAYRRDGGGLTLDGGDIDPNDTLAAQRLGIGTVYQEVNLLPNLSVAENLFLGRQPRRFGMVDIRTMNRQARELLAQYGLTIDVTAQLDRFSVAVQQVIAIARAVDLSGKVLILDEPTASLDTQEVAMLFGIIRNLKERGLGIVFITHFLEQVYEISDRITVLRNGRLVGTRDTEKPIRLLSGGNQQKAILARWLATNPDFLILDEPTRGIDVGAHAEIIRLIEDLCAKGMSLVVISSELEELVAYSSRVIVLRDREHIAELSGNSITASGIVDAIAAAEKNTEDA